MREQVPPPTVRFEFKQPTPGQAGKQKQKTATAVPRVPPSPRDQEAGSTRPRFAQKQGAPQQETQDPHEALEMEPGEAERWLGMDEDEDIME